MDPRLSVSKSSSSRIRKHSSLANKRLVLPPPKSTRSSSSSSSSRPPPTFVNADPTNFRLVVQQLTGTPPPSASPSPARDPLPLPPRSKPSRLQRIAPPPLHHQRQHNHRFFQQDHRAPPYHDSNHDLHHQYIQQNINHVQYHIQAQQNSTLRQSSSSPHLNPNLSSLSPQLISAPSAQTSSGTMLAPSLHRITSPWLVSSCSSVLPPPLPAPFPNNAEKLARHVERDFMDPFSASARLYAHSPSSGIVHAHTASILDPPFTSSDHGFSPLTGRQFLHSPTSTYGQVMLPGSPHNGLIGPISSLNAQLLPSHTSYGHPMPALPSPAALSPISPYPHPYSPSTAFPWLPPWPPSPFLSPPPPLSCLSPPPYSPLSCLSPPPYSPSLFPPSPGLPLFAGNHAGFSFQPANDHSDKTS